MSVFTGILTSFSFSMNFTMISSALPFLRERTQRQLRNRIYDVLANVNEHLDDIGKELGIELKISSYVARHSYATVLKRAGIATSIISESLGHSSERITQVYLDSFGNEQMDDAMKNLL